LHTELGARFDAAPGFVGYVDTELRQLPRAPKSVSSSPAFCAPPAFRRWFSLQPRQAQWHTCLRSGTVSGIQRPGPPLAQAQAAAGSGVQPGWVSGDGPDRKGDLIGVGRNQPDSCFAHEHRASL